jgi:hypothetical protein
MTQTLPEITPLIDETPEFDAVIAQFGPLPEIDIPAPVVAYMDEVEKLAQEAVAGVHVPEGPLAGSEEPEAPDDEEPEPKRCEQCFAPMDEPDAEICEDCADPDSDDEEPEERDDED